MQMDMPPAKRRPSWDLKRISGGVLVQEPDAHDRMRSDLKVVTKRQPTREELQALLFGWKVAKHVKSNAIVFARPAAHWGSARGK